MFCSCSRLSMLSARSNARHLGCSATMNLCMLTTVLACALPCIPIERLATIQKLFNRVTGPPKLHSIKPIAAAQSQIANSSIKRTTPISPISPGIYQKIDAGIQYLLDSDAGVYISTFQLMKEVLKLEASIHKLPEVRE